MHLFLYVLYTSMLCALAPPVLRYTHRTLFTRPVMTSSLQDFAKAGLTAIYTADAEHFDAAFDAFVSPHAEIHVNDKVLTRDDFRARVRRSEMVQSVHVEFPGALDVPRKREGADADAAAGPEEGLVGIFYKVTHALKFRVRVTPMLNIEEVTLNARIEQDPAVQADESGDRRRLTFVWATAVTFRPPINLNPAAHLGQT